MAMHPVESGLADADSMAGRRRAAILANVGRTCPQLGANWAQLATMGYTDPQAFFQAVIDGQA